MSDDTGQHGGSVTQIHEEFWRVQRADGSLAGWVVWVESWQGFNYRTHRRNHGGLGPRLGEYATLDEAADALLQPVGPPPPRYPRRVKDGRPARVRRL